MVNERVDEATAFRMFAYWSSVLDLGRWSIKFQWKVKATEMNFKDAFGCATFSKATRLAIIQIIDQDDVTEPMGEFNYERTLVHELLHLKMAFLDDSGDDLRDTLTHAMIDDLAVSFVKARTEKIENVKI